MMALEAHREWVSRCLADRLESSAGPSRTTALGLKRKNDQASPYDEERGLENRKKIVESTQEGEVDDKMHGIHEIHEISMISKQLPSHASSRSSSLELLLEFRKLRMMRPVPSSIPVSLASRPLDPTKQRRL